MSVDGSKRRLEPSASEFALCWPPTEVADERADLLFDPYIVPEPEAHTWEAELPRPPLDPAESADGC